MSKLTLLHASCADPSVDAVVNAANDRLWAGGGICGVMFQKAGRCTKCPVCRSAPQQTRPFSRLTAIR